MLYRGIGRLLAAKPISVGAQLSAPAFFGRFYNAGRPHYARRPSRKSRLGNTIEPQPVIWTARRKRLLTLFVAWHVVPICVALTVYGFWTRRRVAEEVRRMQLVVTGKEAREASFQKLFRDEIAQVQHCLLLALCNRSCSTRVHASYGFHIVVMIGCPA